MLEFTVLQMEKYTESRYRFMVTMVWIVLLIVMEILMQVKLFREGRVVVKSSADKDSDFVKVKDGIV